MHVSKGTLELNGGFYENPIDRLPISKKLEQYREWKETERTSFRSLWIDRYVSENGKQTVFESVELKISNRNKCFLDGKELKAEGDVSKVIEIFAQLKTS